MMFLLSCFFLLSGSLIPPSQDKPVKRSVEALEDANGEPLRTSSAPGKKINLFIYLFGVAGADWFAPPALGRENGLTEGAEEFSSSMPKVTFFLVHLNCASSKGSLFLLSMVARHIRSRRKEQHTEKRLPPKPPESELGQLPRGQTQTKKIVHRNGACLSKLSVIRFNYRPITNEHGLAYIICRTCGVVKHTTPHT